MSETKSYLVVFMGTRQENGARVDGNVAVDFTMPLTVNKVKDLEAQLMADHNLVTAVVVNLIPLGN